MAIGFGPPQVDFYSALSGLGDTIQNNAKLARENALRDALKDGLPKTADGSIDYNTIGTIAAQHGADLPTTLKIAALGEEQRQRRLQLAASDDFRKTLTGMFGGTPSQPPAPVVASAPQSGPGRAPVMPTSKVWGDKEAEDAGLYDKPAQPASTSSFSELSGKRPDMLASLRNPAPAQPPQTKSATATAFDGIGAQHIPALVAAMASPNLPSGDRELAGKLLTRALDDSKDTDKIRTLQALKEQSGFPGTILDLEMALRKNSSPSINIDQKQETAEAQAAGKAAGERRAAMFAAANKATDNLANLTRVQTLLDQIDQGKLQPSRMTISAWAKNLGVNDDFAKSIGLDPSKVGDAQAIQALTNELVLGKIGAGGLPANNFSDADRQFLSDTVPKLGNDPRANKIVIEAARRVQNANLQRAIDFQQWRSDPANKDRSFEDFELSRARATQQMDRFGDLRKQAEALLPSADTPSGNAGGFNWRVK